MEKKEQGSVDDLISEMVKETEDLRKALSRLLAECCDRQGALLRPTKDAVKQAVLALHPRGGAKHRYPGILE